MKLVVSPLLCFSILLLKNCANALNVKIYGVNYNAIKGVDWATDSSKCKSEAEIQLDMNTIKQVTDTVRIVSLYECDQAKLVLIAAKNAGLQVHLGVKTIQTIGVQQQEWNKLTQLIDANLIDNNVVSLSVGNMAIFTEESEVEVAIRNFYRVRDYIRGRGLTTSLTVTDSMEAYIANPALMNVVDFISVSFSAFWFGFDVNEGAAVTLDRFRDLRTANTKYRKKIVLSETDWSSNGSDLDAGIASPKNQARFFSDLYQVAFAYNFEFCWYTAFDESWRENEVERSFGLFDGNRTLKSNIVQLSITTRQPNYIQNEGTHLFLSEYERNVYMWEKMYDQFMNEGQVWYLDTLTKQVRSKSSDRCLDVFDNHDLHVRSCSESAMSQKWTYHNDTKQLESQTFCLDIDVATSNELYLSNCSSNSINQRWNFTNVGYF
ncbi:ricin b lectin-like protein [Plasmopara halstedii]|uniref:glucan endo-1,3-beta-D-glucosidase n=1 Tax=Plasmopara halstedii TaxID=4781 RepID=A0A0P1AFA4_PLAHL|nr:ricin b lectin-like protein [Plasmopara halstedii]CEG39300.1 ricin b lectin-like protein [Plasmopara halstedii]|eukprot:XP_024575669.1 ricin b lectin-like protein [Plasmopara halstedii]